MQRYGTGRMYLNFPGHGEGDDLVSVALGPETYSRLAKIKRVDDPANPLPSESQRAARLTGRGGKPDEEQFRDADGGRAFMLRFSGRAVQCVSWLMTWCGRTTPPSRKG